MYPDVEIDGWRAVAAVQHGCITAGQLVAAGRSPSWVSRAVARDELLRLGRGVFAMGTAPKTWHREIWAACLLAGPRAFAFRRAAAVLWELDGIDPGPDAMEVGVAHGRSARAGAPVRSTRGLLGGDLVPVGGLRVTAPRRTLIDLASLHDPDLLERAAEAALRRGLVREEELRAAAPPGRGRGRGAWRQVIGARPEGAAPTESDAETRFVQLCRSAGLPQPVRQHPVEAGRRFRLDFAWPEILLGVEVDGRAVHGPDALGLDLRRQNHIQLAGWLILRFTFEDVVAYPEATVSEVRRAFRLLAASRPR